MHFKFNSTPKDLEDVSKYPNLINALIENNNTRWTQENLEKLTGRNLIRVFKKVEEVQTSYCKCSIFVLQCSF